MTTAKTRSWPGRILVLLKYVIPLVIIGWLVTSIDPEQRRQLVEHPKNWPLLLVSFALGFVAVWLTFVRWYLLVRTLDIPFSLRDAYRLGFLAYLLNFVSVGSVGGDLFKAVFIAHEHPRRRAEAVATVLVDRLIGLYALLVVTSLATLTVDLGSLNAEMRTICHVTYLLTALGGAGVVMILVPGFTSGAISEFLANLPKVGPILGKLIAGVRMYRNRPGVLLTISLMSLAVHTILSISMYLSARALYPDPPTLGEHLIIVPLSMVVGAIPFTPAGLGTFEFAINKLYIWVPAKPSEVSGILLALVYRVITIAIAGVGAVYYLASRREVRQLLDEAEHELKPDPDPDPDLRVSPESLPSSCESNPSNPRSSASR